MRRHNRRKRVSILGHARSLATNPAFIGLWLGAQTTRAAVGADVLQPLSYDGTNSLSHIQRAVWPAVREGNPIALYLARQTMYALGEDMALERTPTALRRPIAREVQEAWVKAVCDKAEKGDVLSLCLSSRNGAPPCPRKDQ